MKRKVNKGEPPRKKRIQKVDVDPILVEEAAESKRRVDWEHNNELIYSAFIEVALNKKRYPKLSEISELTGLSIKTIHKHTSEGNFDAIKQKYSIFSEAALFQLATKAASGKSKDWTELYFKVVHGLGEKKQVDLTSKGNQIGSFDLSSLTDEELIAYKSIKQKIDGK